MAPKLLITGSTGYIGGTVLDTLVRRHPEYDITVLLRNEPEKFKTLYPHVNVVKGDYDSGDVISAAAAEVDVVVHNGDSDHEPSINALIAGLLRRTDSTTPGFLIHLSGTGLVADWRTPTYHGLQNPKIWSDIHDLDEITSRPAEEMHRNVDAIIQRAAAQHAGQLKTAVVCPPDIYGPGRGPGRTRSVYFPTFVKEVRGVGGVFYGGEGANTRSWVHVEDLMEVYVSLVEAAVRGGEGADWGREGYYFAATQEASQRDIATAAGKILKARGVVPDSEPKALPLEQIDGMMEEFGEPHLGMYMFGANSRTRADRAAKLFGYKAKAPSLWDSMEADMLTCD